MPGLGLFSQHSQKKDAFPSGFELSRGKRSIRSQQLRKQGEGLSHKGTRVSPKSIPGPKTDPWGPPSFHHGT